MIPSVNSSVAVPNLSPVAGWFHPSVWGLWTVPARLQQLQGELQAATAVQGWEWGGAWKISTLTTGMADTICVYVNEYICKYVDM